MKAEVTFILAAIVVSWVMFVFNFVLGYYIGRAVEAGDQLRLKKEKEKKNKPSKYYVSSFSPRSVSSTIQ